MKSLWHQFLGAALLPLLIFAGQIDLGGWFCADGTRCRPALAATCCCGCPEGAGAPGDCHARAGDQAHAAITGTPCHCYYDIQGIPSLLKAEQGFVDLASLPA